MVVSQHVGALNLVQVLRKELWMFSTAGLSLQPQDFLNSVFSKCILKLTVPAVLGTEESVPTKIPSKQRWYNPLGSPESQVQSHIPHGW